MFESIKFQNFKALRDATVPLSRFTLIVGPNGSGKSTALNAFLALNDPSLLSCNQSAGAPNSESVKLTAGWKSERTFCLVTVEWSPISGMSYPKFDGDRSGASIDLGRSRLYSLDASG